MASTMDLMTIPTPSSPRVRKLSTGEIRRSIKEKSQKRLKNSSNGKELKMFSQALITLSSARTESTSTISSREISVTVGSCQLLLLSLSSQAALRTSFTTTIPSTVTVSMLSTCMPWEYLTQLLLMIGLPLILKTVKRLPLLELEPMAQSGVLS